MIKTFCDICGDEITGKNIPSGGHMSIDRLGVTIKRRKMEVRLEILITTAGTANAGDICKYCILDALDNLNDRPKVAVDSDALARIAHAQRDMLQHKTGVK